ALPLPADPLALFLVPAPPAMPQKEPLPAPGRAPVSHVEVRDAVGQRGEEVLVAGRRLLARIRPVREEGEVEMAFGTREMVHPEALELLLDAGLPCEQRGHDDQCP